MKFIVLLPSQGVRRAHQEAPGRGTRKVGIPERNGRTEAGRYGLCGAFSKWTKHLVDRERSEQIVDVVLHGFSKKAVAEFHATTWHLGLVGNLLPGSRVGYI